MALDLGAMQAVERLSSYITRGVYTVSGPFHPFGGAVDIIVVEQQDGGFKSSPWYVRFGKFQGVLKTREKVVNIFVNGTEAGFHMYLDHKGEAYFLKDADSNEEEFSSSPTTSEDETDGDTKNGHFKKTQSCDYESNQTESLSRIDVENGKVVARTNSRPSRIFGLVFGRKSMKEDACVDNMPRLNSLERAEIAADLLETKWSTNLPTNRRGRNSTRTAFKKGGKEAGANEDQSCGSHDEALGSLDEGNADKPSNDIVNAEHIDEVTRQGSPRLRTHEEVIEVYRSETADIVDRREVLTDIPDTETSEFDAASGDSLSRSTTSGSKFSLLFNEKDQEPDRRDADLTPSDSADQSGDREVSSYIYDKIESSSVRFDAADDHVGEFLILSSDSNEQAKPSVEVAYDKAEHTLEENIGAVNGASTEENSTECKLCHHQHFESDDYVKYPPHDRACREDFESPTAKCNITEPPILNAGQIGMDSLSSPDAQLLSSDSTVEAIKQGKEAECVLQKTNPPSVIGILENQSMEEIKPAWLCSCTTGFEVAQPLISNHDTASQYKYIFPDSNNLGAHDEEVATVTEGVKINEFELSGVVTATEDLGVNFNSDKAADVSIPSLKSIVDDQFLFSKTENCACSEVSSQSIITAKEVHKEENLLLAPEGDVEENEPNDIKVEMSPKALSAAPTAQSSPIWIPAGRTRSEKSGLLAKSLPNFRSHIHDLDSSDTFHPLSHSLRLNSLMQEQGTSKEKLLSSSELEAGSAIKDVQVVPVSETVTPDVDVASLKPEPDTCKGECSGSSQLEAGYASEVILVAPTSETAPVNVDAKSSIKQTGSTVSPTVEMSLCKHLLFEGMGAEAASQAFDAEKVDLERFTVLGPSIVKNNRLTVRIDGQYFPWDSAAHIVLGMISFGQEQLFDLEGMIAVDRAEKTPDSDPSKAIVRTGGAWKLWPFSFKKSRTMTTEHLAPDETKEKDAKIAQEDNLSGANNTSKPKAMKKKVQSLTPSSEQLASLNLKEGRNLVTFNFETAMLGRQQVDARIYLWKWNTRIVISDVDGTITKSDVLGQFMPLVGKDWSQTGVTHLFSSIKENGFQFLFLSARAISQAYLTRQFLFNLKQDGKALPDGPVVISPDGLFPSLYREVIRRAPHEFKISCLEEIRALFPPDCNPFYAGFGNRHTDEISYLKVGIPKGKIFTINPKGEVAVNHRVDTKSYTSLHALVNGMFPATTSAEQEDYNSWNFWRLPLPDIDI